MGVKLKMREAEWEALERDWTSTNDQTKGAIPQTALTALCLHQTSDSTLH